MSAAAAGAMAAVFTQSSTAVAVILAGFMASGAIGSATGLAIILGADLGSAIVAQILNSRISLLTPMLLLAGVMLFLQGPRRKLRQVGRILIGLALIFLSLDLVRDASVPLVGNGAARTAMIYLAGDLVLSFLIAALLAWLVHSSVAAVLLFATLAQQGLLPLEAAFVMVLGANFGGAFIAVMLTLKAGRPVRRVFGANFVLRGGGAALAVPLLSLVAASDVVPGFSPAQQTLNVHLLFNLLLLVLGLPFIRAFMRAAERLLPNRDPGEIPAAVRTALDRGVQNQPAMAFACAQRELIEMSNRIEVMLREGMNLFESYSELTVRGLNADMTDIARMSLNLRVYLSGIRSEDSGGARQCKTGI